MSDLINAAKESYAAMCRYQLAQAPVFYSDEAYQAWCMSDSGNVDLENAWYAIKTTIGEDFELYDDELNALEDQITAQKCPFRVDAQRDHDMLNLINKIAGAQVASCVFHFMVTRKTGLDALERITQG